jgi:hypothetical protein
MYIPLLVKQNQTFKVGTGHSPQTLPDIYISTNGPQMSLLCSPQVASWELHIKDLQKIAKIVYIYNYFCLKIIIEVKNYYRLMGVRRFGKITSRDWVGGRLHCANCMESGLGEQLSSFGVPS